MNAGPELNALIAERVMGHTVAMAPAVWSGEDWFMSDSPTARNVLAIINADFTPGASFPPAYPILDFSGDIAARASGARLSNQRRYSSCVFTTFAFCYNPSAFAAPPVDVMPIGRDGR